MQATSVAKSNLRKARSVLTNDPRRLPGVSMRSPRGRRFRDIVETLMVEFGADCDPVRLRELAGLKFSAEEVQAAVVHGNTRAVEDLVRLSNLIARRETELRARHQPKRAPALADILSRHHDPRAAE